MKRPLAFQEQGLHGLTPAEADLLCSVKRRAQSKFKRFSSSLPG